MVQRVCRALLGRDDADDAWSETFIAAMRAYPDLRPNSNIPGWLATIAHHKAVDLLRNRTRRPRPSPALPETAISDPPLPDEQLRQALASLPEKQRGAVVYRYLADLPYAQVAELLDCSEAAARRSAADGIAHLRRLYPQGASK
jgi:RNA polymerase sigma factor (sigma-70 family)